MQNRLTQGREADVVTWIGIGIRCLGGVKAADGIEMVEQVPGFGIGLHHEAQRPAEAEFMGDATQNRKPRRRTQPAMGSR